MQLGATRTSHKSVMESFNQRPDIDYSILNGNDYQAIQRRIEEQARANSANEFNYRCLVNDPQYRHAMTLDYINAKQKLLSSGQFGSYVGQQDRRQSGFSNATYEGIHRDRIAAEYGVVMSQFQNRFKDPTYENLRISSSGDRLNIYHDRIGYLGMKTFDLGGVAFQTMFEAMYLYILDDIEEKQRASRSRAGVHFLERIGMETDISAYYKAHRKSNHGGASSALYAFNESESFSFRRGCMKCGLKTDVDAMDEADNRKAKNHPYQRTFYGHPALKDHKVTENNK
jgi:hypothetical protein